MLFFFLGLIIGSVGMTLLNSISELISTFTEWVKAKMGLSITNYNALMNKIIEEVGGGDDSSSTKAIGFSIADEEDIDDDE